MSIQNNFVNIGKIWSTEEDLKLIKHYVDEQLNVIQIAKLHSRFPRGIASRLVHLKIIKDSLECRGYIDYEKQDPIYYEEIKKYKQEKRDKKREKKNNSLQIINISPQGCMNYNTSTSIEKDILVIKKDIQNINEKLDAILLILQNVYSVEIEEIEV